ncbi:GTPase IMAP family member 7 isoform X2 [Salmo trutta]|uniref:GTPase IMAP family member 7 isoform X2 n=1 Tax=Salmo trutta TaxID=8032 RepID=UPI00113159E3|nr:GTPase IMAP family member 7-like isoform X2 [Salmo trutta]
MGSWSSPENGGDTSDVRLLLVGPKRTGKSSCGNTMLGRKAFDTRGGGPSTAASGTAAGHDVTVIDARGWGFSEDSVPREEKKELLRALSLCGPGPHVVLLVIPLLDFTEMERQAVERRMEVMTSSVWRHTMVLFTFGDRLKGRGRSLEQHIQSGGLALQWLMEKCRYRCHVLDNKEGQWEGKEGRGQVEALVSRVKDMLQENGGWHFSLHMYHRLEEEWSRREQELRERMEGEREMKIERERMREIVEERQGQEEWETQRAIGRGDERSVVKMVTPYEPGRGQRRAFCTIRRHLA